MGFPMKRDEFPLGVTPVTAKDLPALQAKFANGDSTDKAYTRLSAQIAFLTGHEHAFNRDGRAYTRKDWEDAMHKSLSHLNNELMLGFNSEVIDVLTLCYTALTDTARYGGDPLLGREQGESTGVHSLHTMLQAQYVFGKALEENPALANDVNFFRYFQLSCVLLAVHDLGEILGEAGSVAQVAHTGNWAIKDKAEFERRTFNFAVRLAVKTVTEGRPWNDFYKRIDKVKSLMDVQNKGGEKSDEQLVEELQANMGAEVKLGQRGEQLFGFLKTAWEWVEEPEKSRSPFFGYLATVCERVQGGRHIVRQMKSSHSPVLNDGKMEMMQTSYLTPGYRILANADYNEGKLAPLCAAMDKSDPVQKAIGEAAVKRAYEVAIDLVERSADAFFIDPAIKETGLCKDGLPFTPDVAEKRLQEIGVAADVAKAESNAMRDLCKAFNDKALYLGATALERKQAIAMYEKAIAEKYLPGFVERNGKKAAENLLRDRPAVLTGVRHLTQDEIAKHIDKLIPKYMKG